LGGNQSQDGNNSRKEVHARRLGKEEKEKNKERRIEGKRTSCFLYINTVSMDIADS
jgi:hypothetical protein